jgi:hypothetical protein
MEEIFRFNAAAWLGSTTHLVRYEEMVAALRRLDTRESELYFARLLDACGIAMPTDWRERVLIGADRRQSATARENLNAIEAELPDELPEAQKRLVNYAAPGLRELLGYGPR